MLTQPDPPFLPLHAVLVPIEGERWIIAIADHHVNRAAGDLEEPQQQFWFPSRQRQCSLRAAHAVLQRERGGSGRRLAAELTVCGLTAGGSRIRTIGPSRTTGIRAPELCAQGQPRRVRIPKCSAEPLS